MDTRTYLLKLEENLMTGSARWIADFTESFRDHLVKGERFDMMVRGGTRPRGFLLSKLFAYFSLPNYSVACYVYSPKVDAKDLDDLTRLVLEHMKENDLTWSWFVLPREDAPSAKLQEFLNKKDIREVGIALVDLSSGGVTTNPSYVGRRMADHVRCFR